MPGISVLGLAGALSLTACSGPEFTFRGYTERSNCGQVIDAELAAGSVLGGAFDGEQALRSELVVELSGTVFELPVLVEITCGRNSRVESVYYIADAEDPADTAVVFEHFSAELENEYGAPSEAETAVSRRRTFLCAEPATLLVEEWRLAEDEHEVYLAVVPRAESC